MNSSQNTLLKQAQRMEQQQMPFALVTVVRCQSPASAKPGAKALVTAEGIVTGWIGGGCAQPIVVKATKDALTSGRSALIRISPDQESVTIPGVKQYKMVCHSGGTMDIFIDPFVPAKHILVIGIAPTAVKFAELARSLNFSITAAFPNTSEELFPHATVIPSLDHAELQAVAPAIALVATQGNRDEAGLEAAIASNAPYIALVASERKAQKLRAYLLDRGHSAERVASIVAPVGVEIGATTPEEIALSALAGIVKESHMGSISAPSPDPAPSAKLEGEAAHDNSTEAIDLVCGMSVDIASAEHSSYHNDTDYYFCNAHCKNAFDADPHSYIGRAAQATPTAS